MSITYAVPDLHGRYDLFRAFIGVINRHHGGTDEIARHPGEITVVFLGDYVDRGPESRQIVEALMVGPQEGIAWICLKGNHEDMMVETLTQPLDPGWWIGNGGSATADSYGGEVPTSHVEWLRDLPLFYQDEHRFFSHSGGNPGKSVDDQSEADLCWFRCDRIFDYTINGKHTVHGHTPFPDGPVRLTGRTNLDTYAVGTGILTVGVFDDAVPGGPIQLISISAGEGF